MFKRARDLLVKKELDEDKQGLEFEKGDFLALVIAATMTFLPAIIGVILFFAGISLLFLKVFSN